MGAPAPAGRGPDAVPAGSRILVVDDEVGMRQACRKVLEAEGFEVHTAEDGAAGLELFERRQDFAAALVDMKMPRMGGIELIERIRAMDEDVVLLVITAYATIETAVEAVKRGAYGYIPKPFTPAELLLPVRNGLERRALSLEAKQLRREREQQLLELAFERSRSGAILRCMQDGVVVVNREGRVVLANPAFGRMLPVCVPAGLDAVMRAGGPAAAPAAGGSLALLGELKCPELESVLREALSGAGGIESRQLAAGESVYTVSAAPLRDGGPEPLGAVAVLTDVTGLKRLEQAKSRFVSLVAHEVKSPLAAIEGYLGAVLAEGAEPVPPGAKPMLERCLVRARTLREMVSELMSLRAAETGQFLLSRQALAPADAVGEAVESLGEVAAAAGVALEWASERHRAVPAVLADRKAFASIAGNLIGNAVKYTPRGGRVTVSLEQRDPYVALVVADTGIGLAKEDCARIFEEFYRVRSERTAAIAGTGLGLPLVKRLVDLHQGRIEVTSEPGCGSVFTVLLPAG